LGTTSELIHFGVSSRIATIDFTPNPNRRHTRGKRGKNLEGINDLQVDFEESRVDRHKVQSVSRSIERRKRELSKAKSFAYRGFKGKVPPELGKQERDAFIREQARKNRVKSGTEGQPHWKRWLKDESKVKCGPKPINLAHVMGRFKRTGKLPSCSVEEIQKADQTSVKAQDRKRLIQAMLNMSGDVEKNPGPEPCIYAGRRIMGFRRRVPGNRGKIMTCHDCGVTLRDIHRNRGLHPGVKNPDDNDLFDFSCSSTTSTEESTPETPVPSELPKQLPVVIHTKEPQIPLLDGDRVPLEVRIGVMSKLLKTKLNTGSVQQKARIERYNGDCRICTSMGVAEIKRDFVVVDLIATRPTGLIRKVLNYLSCSRGKDRVKLSYIPHLVSALVVEFDRNANSKTVKANIRPKFRRMAAFPMPDVNTIHYTVGTELIAMEIIKRSSYFFLEADETTPPMKRLDALSSMQSEPECLRRHY
jgi:hypothetical protein